MNKLYILGALALANVEAYINLGTYTLIYIVPGTGIGGAYTYAVSSDCYSAGTATTLGMNNIYHQYYSFTLTKGTATYAALSVITPAIAGAITTILISITAAYTGCYHSHLYNWLAQPQIAATTVVAGFASSAVAYGYAMSGTAVTSCGALALVTTTLFKSSVFYGAQFQSSTGITTTAAGISASTITVPFWGRVGPLYTTAKAAVA